MIHTSMYDLWVATSHYHLKKQSYHRVKIYYMFMQMTKDLRT